MNGINRKSNLRTILRSSSSVHWSVLSYPSVLSSSSSSLRPASSDEEDVSEYGCSRVLTTTISLPLEVIEALEIDFTSTGVVVIPACFTHAQDGVLSKHTFIPGYMQMSLSYCAICE